MTRAAQPQRRASQWLVPEDPATALARDGFGLGDWRVEPSQRRIVSRRQQQQLDPRLMDLLVFLTTRPGQIVSRDEILDTVWSDAVVSENTLTQAISRLRRVLGDDHRAARYIETVSRSGYRLVAVVEWPGSSTPVAVAPPAEPKAASSDSAATSVETSAGSQDDAGSSFGQRLAAGWILPLVALAGAGVYFSRPSPPSVSETDPTRPLPEVRPALTHVGKQFDPVLSPDGQHVAFAWQGPGEGDYDSTSDYDLWLQQIDSNEPVQLTDHGDEERLPAWAPDGLSLVYARYSPAGQTCGLYRIAVIGGSPNRFADCPRNLRSIDASPDGQSLVLSVTEAPGEPWGVFRLDLETGDRHRLTQPPEGSLGDYHPAVSPDGRWIAFGRRSNDFRHDVMVAAADGTGARSLTDDPWGQVRGLEWSADSRSVLYSSNRAGRFVLWRANLEGGEPERLPILDDWIVQPSLDRSGQRLIYRTFRDVVDLYALPLIAPGQAVGEPERVLASTRSERDPLVSPDGTTIAFLSDRSGTLELWTGSVTGDQLLQRTDLAGPRPESPAWSPDGESLVFDTAVDGHADLWRLEADSQRPERLTADPGNERNATFSRDGSAIYFTSDRGGAWNIYSMPADGGPARQITRDGAFLAIESADGSALFLSRPDQPGIWRQSLAGGEPERLIDDLSLIDWGSWVVGRDGIYYLRRNPTEIAFRPFDRDEPSSVYQPPKQMPYLARNLSLAPDGQTLLFAMIDRSDNEVIRVDWGGF